MSGLVVGGAQAQHARLPPHQRVDDAELVAHQALLDHDAGVLGHLAHQLPGTHKLLGRVTEADPLVAAAIDGLHHHGEAHGGELLVEPRPRGIPDATGGELSHSLIHEGGIGGVLVCRGHPLPMADVEEPALVARGLPAFGRNVAGESQTPAQLDGAVEVELADAGKDAAHALGTAALLERPHVSRVDRPALVGDELCPGRLRGKPVGHNHMAAHALGLAHDVDTPQ